MVYLKSVFENDPINNYSAEKSETDKLMSKYNVEDKAAFDYFIDSRYQSRLLHYNEAENALIHAIKEARKTGEHYLLYAFFSHLAFLQTFKGNTIGAVSSFRYAKKEAIALDDAQLQVLVDINISDIYYRNSFYSQSLFYLNQADSIINRGGIKEQRLKNAINNNRSENFFRMNDIDSLKKYHQALIDAKSGTSKLYVYRHRTAYYITLLQHDYKSAIERMQALRHDSLYVYDNTDELNLADAYYNNGQLDSAKSIINRLLADPTQNNHPEIKYHLYEVLGEIAEKGNDNKQAGYDFKMALQQAETNISRLTQVGNISSGIKTDELEGFFVQKVSGYKRERVWLIFAIAGTVIALIIGSLFFRNIRQKRYYEKLLFNTKKEELAFINSHEVRRHLSNIMGIIDTIQHSENKEQAYLQAEDHLLSATESLDNAIKNISKKLDD